MANDSNAETSALLIMSTAAVPGADHEAFNRWYDEVHVPDLLTIPGINSCRRYRLSTARLLAGQLKEPQYEYSAIYTISADSDAALAAVAKKIEHLSTQGITLTEAMDYSRVTAAFLLPIAGEVRKDPAYKHSGNRDE